MNNETLNALLTRRSVVARDLSSPGPSAEERDQILAAGHRVPDHGKLGPWRFIVFEGESRETFGEHLATIFMADNPDAGEKNREIEKTRFTRAPLVIAVISAPVEHKVPQWQQELSCGAVCQNMLLAADALGYGAQWITEWYAYHPSVNTVLGLQKNERVAGFIYVGAKTAQPGERVRPALDERVLYWQ